MLRHRRAFTLIELLVVMAVVAVLIVLVLPVISTVKKRALDARSMANLKQIGVALNLFIAENNGYIMPRNYVSDETTPQGQSRYWTATLYNSHYIKDKSVFYDPRVPPHGPEGSDPKKQIENATPQTYGMRDWVSPGQSFSTGIRLAKPIVTVQHPSDFFIVADSYWVTWGTPGYGITPDAGTNPQNLVRLNERGMANALFLDGHVEEKSGEYFETLGQTQGQYSQNRPYPTWSPTKN